jgi:hypothetical protein
MIIRKLPLHLAAGTLALGIAIAAPAAAAAQPTPGRLFRFSSCFTCSQHNPTVAGNAAGDFLGTWLEPRNVISEGVFSRVFNAKLTPFGNDFEVAPGAPGDPPQFDGAAVADSQGNFVVAWASQADGQSVILAQHFDPQGNPLGAEIEVASDPGSGPGTPSDSKPAIAAAPGGGFVVAWVSLVTGDDPPGPPRVMARRFDATGAASGPAVQLSTSAALTDRPSLCVSSTGRVHVAWTFTDELLPFQASPVGVVVRRLSPAGVPIGPEQVVSPAVDSESSLAIACGRGNTYVVAWQTAQAPAVSGSDIVVRRFTRLGRAVGTPFVLNQLVDQDQMNPALAVDSSGAFVAVWEGNPAGVHNVRGRRFAGDLTPLSNEFAVYNAGQGTFAALRPAISILGAGSGFVVAVDSPGGILGRIFSSSGAQSAANAANAAENAETAEAVDAAAAALAADVVDGSGTTGNGRGAGGLWH